MESDTVTIRPAAQTYDDGIAFARYVDIASEGVFRKVLGSCFEDILATAFIVPDHDLSFTQTVFAELNGAIVGMASGYTAAEHSSSTDLPLRQASGSRFRRMTGLAILGLFSRIVGRLHDDAFYVQFLAVDEDARGRGIGTMLLGYMEKRAMDQDCLWLSLDVSGKNPGAHRLYTRFGFEVVSEWPRYSFIPAAVYRMDKEIRNATP